MKAKVDLTKGPVSSAIIQMTLPMMIGMVGMVAFNLADTYFIGKLGTLALAAMGFTLPVVMMQGAISMGLGVGASAIISRAIGENDNEKVKRLTTDALILSVLIVIFFVFVGILTIDPLFTLLGANAEELVLVKRYMRIWYLSVAFVVIPMIGNNAMRAAGNTLIPSLVMLTSIVLNIILDPLLIFGIGPFPRLEIEGAALATALARCVSLVVSLLFLHFKFGMLTFKFDGIKKTLNSWKQIFYIGIPAALTHMLIPLSMGFLTRLISSEGSYAVAAFGVCTRLEMFVLSPVISLAAIITPFTGQNFGAEKYSRISQGLKFANLFSVFLGIGIWIFFFFFGAWTGKLFDKSELVYNNVALYLKIVAVSYGFHGASLISASVFNALNKPFSAMALNFFKLIILLIPFAWFGQKFAGLTGIFIGITLSFLISGIVSWLVLIKYFKDISDCEK